MKKKTNNRSIGSNSEKIYGGRRKRFPFLHSNSERDIANLNFPRPKCVLYQLEMRAIHSFVRLFGLHASCHLIRGMAIRMGWMNTKKKRQHIKSSVCTMYMYTAHSIVFVMHVDLSFFRRSDGFFFFFRLAYLNSTIRTLTHFHRVSCKTTKNHWTIRLRKEKSDYWLHLNMKSSEIKMLRDLPNKNKIIQL